MSSYPAMIQPTRPATQAARVALICDFLEEDWPSMELTAQMIFDHLRSEAGSLFHVDRIRPKLPRRFAALAAGRRFAFNADRLVGRFFDYPRALRSRQGSFDVFHILDHSYAHLGCQLPAGRTVVTCHDLDAFRCLMRPSSGSRRLILRAMASRILEGLQRAQRVLCVSAATRDELAAEKLVAPDRLAVIHNGVHPACSPHPDPEADAEAMRLCDAGADSIPLLHVGSTIPRKRIDFLLQVIAEVRKHRPRVILLRVGGPLTRAQQDLAATLGLERSIRTLPRLTPRLLSAVYRRAVLVLQTSEREGFGLPVAEAMTCGTPVVASEVPALREVGGEAASYCPVGALAAWTEEVIRLIDEYVSNHAHPPERRVRALTQAAKFSWAEHARQLMAVYRELP